MQEQIAFYERKLSFEMDPADLWQAIEHGEEIVPIDTRQTFAYEKEHIPTAMNLPHREMSEERTKHLDRSKLYVTYCDGIGCNGSTRGANKMAKLGFRVKELIGGIEWWKFDGYATKGLVPTAGTGLTCAC